MQKIDVRSKIIYHGSEIKYAEIRSRIELIKRRISSEIIQGMEKVVIALQRTPDFICSVIALLELNITYLPLELNQPEERISYILEDSGSRAVITTSEFCELFKNNLQILLDQDVMADMRIIENVPTENMLAYILYTSGSTGKPKGVEITRKGLNNFIKAIPALIDFKAGKKIICLTSFGFDIFFLEGILPLYLGMTVVLADDKERHDTSCIARLIMENDVNIMQITPSAMEMFLKDSRAGNCLNILSEIMLGGENLSLKLLQTLQNKSRARIYNMYGPTETTIWSAVSELTKKNRIDIGKPILNTEIFIFNENMEEVGIGKIGELYIAGDGLAQGYIGKRDLTEQRFLHIHENNCLVYRTGDLGRINENGDIEYIGRCDNQIKFYGYRIELEEIETLINQVQGIDASIAFVEKINDSKKTLNAIYIGEDDIDEDKIRGSLKRKLPSYMIPSGYYHMNLFIYNLNGKIDRRASVEKYLHEKQKGVGKKEQITKNSDTVIMNGVIKIISSLMEENVKAAIIPKSKIIELGIDSIKFVQMIVNLEEEFHIEIEFEKMTSSELDTVETIVKYISSKRVR